MFIKRLKNLRIDRDIKQKELADFLKISPNTYSQYENDNRHFPIEFIIELAKFYDTSVDYILGLTNEPKPYPRTKSKNLSN